MKISVVQMETLTVLTYSPPSLIESSPSYATCQIYLLYTGQHYDALMSSDLRRTGRFAPDSSHDEAAIACAHTHKQAWEDNLRTRMRKRIKCLGCNCVVMDTTAFQKHCSEVEHDEDFCYECEDIEVTEMVATADAD